MASLLLLPVMDPALHLISSRGIAHGCESAPRIDRDGLPLQSLALRGIA